MFADFVPGTGRVALSVAISTSLDAATLLNKLDTYPFGCSEQITSIAMAMLYMKDLAGEAHFSIAGDIDQRLQDAVARLLSRQDSNGSFGLWSVGGQGRLARRLCHRFPDARARARLQGAGDRLHAWRSTACAITSPTIRSPNKNGGRDLAYALYVLARNKAAPIGDLRYIADTKLGAIATPIAKAQIGAALAMLGDKNRAGAAFQRRARADIPAKPALEFGRADFGSMLRDSAALVTLASESDAAPRIVDDAVLRVDAARALSPYTSTQEDAWLVLAARALAKKLNAISLTVNGDARQGALYRTLRADQLAHAAEGDQ